MNWKEFLKPGVGKIIIFFVGAVIIYFYLDIYANSYTSGPTDLFHFTYNDINFGILFIVVIIVWYLISCFVVLGYNKLKNKK
jgi:uncharacterized membrane protein